MSDARRAGRPDADTASRADLREELRRSREALRQREDELERLNAELEDTNRGVVALYAELDKRDQHKNEFLATLAHELRNPLGVLGAAIQTVRDHEGVGSGLLRPLEVADRQLWHLARLVDDLLDVSRIDQGKITLRPEIVDLTEVVTRAVAATGDLYRDRGHDLVVELGDEPLVLEADPLRLEQILENLLTNAAKYTSDGGRIEVRTERDGDDAVLTVEDSGIGIAEEALGRIFQLFAQADVSLDRSSGGLGLGLALVQRLVHLHGGTVRAESEGEGEGSRFIVRLPVAPGLSKPEEGRREEGADVVTPKERKISILLVEDNQDAREMLGLLLEGRGFEVATAPDGASGVETYADQGPFDAAVVDIGLPELDGYGVARQIRAMETGGDVLLVALSGYGREEDQERSREAGFNHHLVKPVEPDQLCRLLADEVGGGEGG